MTYRLPSKIFYLNLTLSVCSKRIVYIPELRMHLLAGNKNAGFTNFYEGFHLILYCCSSHFNYQNNFFLVSQLDKMTIFLSSDALIWTLKKGSPYQNPFLSAQILRFFLLLFFFAVRITDLLPLKPFCRAHLSLNFQN